MQIHCARQSPPAAHSASCRRQKQFESPKHRHGKVALAENENPPATILSPASIESKYHLLHKCTQRQQQPTFFLPLGYIRASWLSPACICISSTEAHACGRGCQLSGYPLTIVFQGCCYIGAGLTRVFFRLIYMGKGEIQSEGYPLPFRPLVYTPAGCYRAA